MKLKALLHKRVPEICDTLEDHVIDWLDKKAGEIIRLAPHHLRYVSQVFKEFDNHEEQHCKGVLDIIERLLGDKAKELTSYELFFLIAVSYLHDCGMAVSDYEMAVLTMVEGKLDGKKPVKTDEAKRLIRNNLYKIYGPNCNSFDDKEIQNWLFVPSKEDTLINYFAELLIDYQNFRNGKIDKIIESKDHNKTNDFLRLEYLRTTHHLRTEKYVMNWGETKFADVPIYGMGQNIANDIAKCCMAHGENATFIQEVFGDRTEEEYCGGTCNLQFVAMMLRLGDIIHFNNDRAHPVLRALHHFKSEYSYQQWRIKANGLVFNVSKGKVSCIANCKIPKDYYDLFAYVDCIDQELALFNALSPKWKKLSNIKFEEKVNRKSIRPDSSFYPVPGLKFSLDQNKVLDLLMGANLYSNKYACLRELYQNSLDACRCQIAKDAAAGRVSMGCIEFGLGQEERNGKTRKYVYCLDNGKGMTKGIVEKYLLHIGSSYYKSSEFFRKQAETGATFTPTSQFGIGMLSCFLIGDEIEITTHEEGSEDGVISCVMEGPNEYFYYQSPKPEDAEKVKNPSGTLVKVFLNNEYNNLLNDDPLENLGYLLWYKIYAASRKSVLRELHSWVHNLYNIMNDFIVVVPEGIEVQISLQNPEGGKKSIKIYNKPLPVAGELKDFVNLNFETYEFCYEGFKKRNDLVINVQDEQCELECCTLINMGDDESRRGSYFCDLGAFCVDGIVVKYVSERESICSKLVHDARCVLNYNGNQRPQLSVDRENFKDKDLKEFDEIAKALLSKLIDKSISEVWKYIIDKGLEDDRTFERIMTDLSDRFKFCEDVFYEHLHNTELFNSELYKKTMYRYWNNNDDTNDPDIRDEDEDEEIDPAADDF